MVATVHENQCKTRSRTVMPACDCPRCKHQRNYIRRLIEYGQYKRIPYQIANRVIDVMLALGWDGRAIASAVGVPYDTGCHWVRMRRKGRELQFGPVTCQLIMNHGTPTEGRTGREGCMVAMRKLQALSRIGYGMKELGTIMAERGLTDGNPKSLLFMYRGGYGPYIGVRLLQAINIVYRELWQWPAPDDTDHNAVRKQAAIKRFPGPLAWDDIDDPSCCPDGVRRYNDIDRTRRKTDVDPAVVTLLVGGRKQGLTATRAEKAEAVRILRNRGKSENEIFVITGIAKASERYPRETEQ